MFHLLLQTDRDPPPMVGAEVQQALEYQVPLEDEGSD